MYTVAFVVNFNIGDFTLSVKNKGSVLYDTCVSLAEMLYNDAFGGGYNYRKYEFATCK